MIGSQACDLVTIDYTLFPPVMKAKYEIEVRMSPG